MALGLSRQKLNEYGEPIYSEMPLAVVIVSRFVGWIGLSVWLGASIVAEFYVTPVVAGALQYIPMFLRHEDWKGRIEGYAHNGGIAQVQLLGFICLFLLLQAALIQMRSWRGSKIVGYLPLILVTILGVALVYVIELRFDLMTAGVGNYVEAYNRLDTLIDIHIGILVILAFVFTWMQSAPSNPPREE